MPQRFAIVSALLTCATLAGLLPGCDRATGGLPADGDAAGATAPRPNIVFVLVDTLRADRIGVYGGPDGQTPVIDALAREGVLFERGIAAAPWTLPSVASLFSGVYPSVHGANNYEVAVTNQQATGVSVNVLPATIQTLAERLQSGGYETAAFVANIFLRPKFGMQQGFDHYDDRFVAAPARAADLNAAALQWLVERDSDKPFFMYLHYMDVHAPYTTDPRFVDPLVRAVADSPTKTQIARAEMNNHQGYFGKSARPYLQDELHRELFQVREYWWARYDAGVRQMDHYLGELRDGLQRLDHWDDLYVIVTADHGEALGEHGRWTHGLTAHQDQLHVPMILRWPGGLPAGKRLGQSVRMFDLMPTVLDQLGLLPEADPAASGDRRDALQCESLMPLITGASSASRYALGEAVKHNPEQFGLVYGRWKLFVDRRHNLVQLFDLDADPHEMRDVSGANAQVVAELSQRLAAMLAENAGRVGATAGEARDATPDEVERLHGLGYVGGGEEEEAEDESP